MIDIKVLAETLVESGCLDFVCVCISRDVVTYVWNVEIEFKYSGVSLSLQAKVDDNLVVTKQPVCALAIDLLRTAKDWELVGPPVLVELLPSEFFEIYGVELKDILVELALEDLKGGVSTEELVSFSYASDSNGYVASRLLR